MGGEIRCKKRFGQNFLIDQTIIQEIVAHINSKQNQTLIEIGPGLGAITEQLLHKCNKLIAIEIDRELITKLTKKFDNELKTNKFVLINQDVLKIDFIDLLKNHITTTTTKIIGNLPYNISTPLLFKLFTLKIESMHFLLQKEVAERLIATPGNHQYGRLSVTAQYHSKINIIFNVGAESFNPIPKVESSMVQFIPHTELPAKAINYQHFNQLVTNAFSHRRKILANSLKKYCTHADLEALNIDPLKRPEQISVEDFVKISNFLVSTDRT